MADVERWHLRLRKAGIGEAAIRGRHMVLRAALEQAVRWGWVHSNVARHAQLRSAKRSPRAAMTADEVRAVLAVAAEIDPMAKLALRIAAVTGARRSELAALQWSDLDGDRLTIDSSIAVRRDAERVGRPELIDAPTKTANGRAVTVDETTVQMIVKQREVREAVGPYMFSIDEGPPNPDRIGWWWQRARIVRHRRRLAASRSAPLGRDDGNHERARRPHCRRPSRPCQRGDDAACLRPRRAVRR